MKGYEVVLSDERTVVLREPRTDEMPVFLRALPSLIALSEAMEGQQQTPGIFLPVNLPDNALDYLYPLVAAITILPDGNKLTEEEVRSLPLWDGMALLMGLQELFPQNFMQAPLNKSLPSDG